MQKRTAPDAMKSQQEHRQTASTASDLRLEDRLPQASSAPVTEVVCGSEVCCSPVRPGVGDWKAGGLVSAISFEFLMSGASC